MSSIIINKLGVPAKNRNGRENITYALTAYNSSNNSTQKIVIDNSIYMLLTGSTQTIYSNVNVLGAFNITGNTYISGSTTIANNLSLSTLNNLSVSNYVQTTGTTNINTISSTLFKNIPYFVDNKRIESDSNFYYSPNHGRLDVRQKAGGGGVLELALMGEHNNDAYGNLLMWGLNDNNKRMSIGFNTTSNYGYIQSYYNGGQKYNIKLNPLGGSVYVAPLGDVYLSNGSYTTYVNGILSFGNNIQMYTTAESTGTFTLENDNDGFILEYLDDLYVYPYTYFNQTISSNNFNASTDFLGTNGTGWRINKDTKSTLEVDNLKIRGTLTASELVINKVRATNGSLWVTDSAKIKVGMTATYYIETENTNTFVAGDIIISKAWNNGAYSYTYKVSSVSNNYVYLLNENGTTPTVVDLVGKEFVRIGNATNTARQGSIYLSSSDANSPYLSVIDNVTSSTISASNHKLRIGNLLGLTMTDGTALSGYGIYTNNGYFEGKIVANSGLISNFTISGNSLYYDNYNSKSSGLLAKDTTVMYAGASSYANRLNAPFRVNSNGDVTCNNLNAGTAGSYLTNYISISSDDMSMIFNTANNLGEIKIATNINAANNSGLRIDDKFSSQYQIITGRNIYMYQGKIDIPYSTSRNITIDNSYQLTGSTIDIIFKGLPTITSTTGCKQVWINTTTGRLYYYNV